MEHPECQYPPRPYVNGVCDNTDPCDPTTITGECVTATTQAPPQKFPDKLPRTGSTLDIFGPIAATIIVFCIWQIGKKIFKKESK